MCRSSADQGAGGAGAAGAGEPGAAGAGELSGAVAGGASADDGASVLVGSAVSLFCSVQPVPNNAKAEIASTPAVFVMLAIVLSRIQN